MSEEKRQFTKEERTAFRKAKERAARNRALDLFKQNFPPDRLEKLQSFTAVKWPIALASADVTEESAEDYSVVSLLVLRLYDLGFRDYRHMAHLSGLNEEMIKTTLENEEFIYHHIAGGALTETGRKTLEMNRISQEPMEGVEDSPRATYEIPRTFQIEAVTGSVIPGYLEPGDKQVSGLEISSRKIILPKDCIELDRQVLQEISARLEEYIQKDVISESASITRVRNLHSEEVMYGECYLAVFSDLHYPLLVLNGYRRAENINLASQYQGKRGQQVAVPVSISQADAAVLAGDSIPSLQDTLVRPDSFFEDLWDLLRETNIVFNEDLNPAEESEDENDDSEEAEETETPEETTEEEAADDSPGSEDEDSGNGYMEEGSNVNDSSRLHEEDSSDAFDSCAEEDSEGCGHMEGDSGDRAYGEDSSDAIDGYLEENPENCGDMDNREDEELLNILREFMEEDPASPETDSLHNGLHGGESHE